MSSKEIEKSPLQEQGSSLKMFANGNSGCNQYIELTEAKLS